MSKTFEATIEELSKISGYSWNFLVDRYNELIDDDCNDWEYFVGVSSERDWTVCDPVLDLRAEERSIFNRIGERGWMRLATPSLAFALY